MTDKQALRKLIEAVEGGSAGPETFVGTIFWEYGYRAFHGSLDAAKALHEALLPGWGWEVGEGDGDPTEAFVSTGRMIGEYKVVGRFGETPSRAWLLAILCAYEAQQ